MANIYIFILALGGLAVSWYIQHKKHKQEKLVCVIGENCDVVVNSKYNKVFGIPNELIGMIYYLGIAIFSLIDIIPLPLMILATAGAAMYSFFLIMIQAFVLKEWCEYCLVSAAISILIFIIKITPIIALY